MMRPLLLVAASLAVGCSFVRDMRAVGAAIGELFWIPGKPDLVVTLGEPGYLDSASDGPQRHYYHESLDQTYVFSPIIVGDETPDWMVACYRGRPSAKTDEVVMQYRAPGGIVAHVVDRAGRPREGVKVTVVSESGDYEESSYTDVDGRISFVPLTSGRWRLRGPGAERTIEVPPRGLVTEELGPR